MGLFRRIKAKRAALDALERMVILGRSELSHN